MKQFFKKLYENSFLGYSIVRPFFVVYNFFRFNRFLPVKTHVKLRFENRLGYKLNLKEPKTINEKINWLKLYDKKEFYTDIADKYAVRDYIKEKIGDQYLIPLVFHTKRAKNVLPENLPDYPFILKTNHDSSGGIIIRDKRLVNWKKIQVTLHGLMKDNYYYNSKEWHYKNIQPCIIAEKLLTDENGRIPYDYKMVCFNGNLVATTVITDRESDKALSTYDVNWKRFECHWGTDFEVGKSVQKPIVYEKMKELAEILAKDFICVRVDFYVLKEKIYFGELTLYDASGFSKFDPEEYDRKFGDMLRLPFES